MEGKYSFLYQSSFCRFVKGKSESSISDEIVKTEISRAFAQSRCFTFFLDQDIIQKIQSGSSEDDISQVLFQQKNQIIESLADGNRSFRNRLLRNAHLSSLLLRSLVLIYRAAASASQKSLLTRRFGLVRGIPGNPAILFSSDETVVIAHVGQGPEWQEVPTIYLGLGLFNSIIFQKTETREKGAYLLAKLLLIEERAIETGYSHIEPLAEKDYQSFNDFIDSIIQTGTLPSSLVKEIPVKKRPKPFSWKMEQEIASLLDARVPDSIMNFSFEENLAGIEMLENLAGRYKWAGDRESLEKVTALLVAASGHDIHSVRNRANILLEKMFSATDFYAPPATRFITVQRGGSYTFSFLLPDKKSPYYLRIYHRVREEIYSSGPRTNYEEIPLVKNSRTGQYTGRKNFTRLGHFDFLVYSRKTVNPQMVNGKDTRGRINVIPEIRGEIILEIFTDIHGHTKLYWNDPGGNTGMVYNEHGEIIRLGRFSDITNHLSDLKERYFITALYLLGVQKRGSNREDWAPEAQSPSPFSPISLTEIEPSLGGEKEFLELVKEAHSLGIKIIVDIIPHLNRKSEVLGEDCVVSCYNEEGGLVQRASTDGRYGSWNDGKLLNYRRYDVWKWLAESIKNLIDKFDIDGIRFDSAHSVPIMMKRNNYPFIFGKESGHKELLEGRIIVNDMEEDHFVTTGYYDSACSDLIANPFYTFLTSEVEKKLLEKNKKYFLYIAECYWGRERQLARSGVISYNSSLFKICENIIHGKSDVREIYHLYTNHYPSALPEGTRLLGIFGNHDERRALNTFGARGLKAAVGLTSFLHDIIMDYEGGAEGEGWKVFVDNIYVNWNQFEAVSNRGLYVFYRDVYAFHRENKGRGYILWANNNMVAAVLKDTGKKKWLAAFNFSDENQFARIQFDDPLLPIKDFALYRLSDPTYSIVTNKYAYYTGRELKISHIETIVPYTERSKRLLLEETERTEDNYSDFIKDSFLRIPSINTPEHFHSNYAWEETAKSLDTYNQFRDFIISAVVPILDGQDFSLISLSLKRILFHTFRQRNSLGSKILSYISDLQNEENTVLSGLGRELAQHYAFGSLIFISAEAEPFSKSGGLANVVYELPKELAALGEKVFVITPLYHHGRDKEIEKMQSGIKKYGIKYTGKNIRINIHDQEYEIGIHFGIVNGVGYYLLEHYDFFAGLYYGYTGYEKFRIRTAFARACAELIVSFNLNPSFTFANEAFAGIFNAVVRTDPVYYRNPNFLRTTFLFLIHNGGWQYFDAYHRYDSGMDLFRITNLPFHLTDQFLDPTDYTKINCMAAGIRFADKVITVSPSYAKQIETACDGMESLLHNVIGISNAIDKNFPVNVKKHIRKIGFDKQYEKDLLDRIEEDPELRKKCRKDFPELFEGPEAVSAIPNRSRREFIIRLKRKLKLQLIHNLTIDPDAILFAMIHRLNEQKGFQLLLEASKGIFRDLNFQGIIGGQPASGDTRGEEIAEGLLRLEHYYPHKVSVTIGFTDVRLPIYSSDVFLMPSMNEPGGISQLEALSCGCLVVARATGGLRDTVQPLSIRNQTVKGNGFLFSDYTAKFFFDGMKRCSDFFTSVSIEQIYRARQNAVKSVDFWDKPAKKYKEKLYDIKEIIKL